MKVLVAEDDPNILRGVLEVLENEGYQVITAADGDEAVRLFLEHRPDFVCLDIMMPRQNGYDVCRQIRRKDDRVPIMFLSAKSEEIDRVVGLELGADDYLMKPFGVKELIARIRAVSRRCMRLAGAADARAPFQLGDLEVLPSELRARRGEVEVELSLREVKILETFHTHRGQVLDRDLLFRACWGVEHHESSRTLDQHISKLRKKIERDPKLPAIIKTVHGAGYRHDG